MRQKKGFSLAEILLALAIVSIIVTMGMTISKKSIANAHRLYFYTGYSSLNDAISDVNFNSGNIAIQTDFDEFGRELAKRFNSATVNQDLTLDGRKRALIQAPNGISYDILCPVANAGSCPRNNAYLIVMTTPKLDNRVNTRTPSRAYFLYYIDPNLNDTGNQGLYPIPLTNVNNTSSAEQANTIDLQERQDILPFYIDDGSVGRNRQVNFVSDPNDGNEASLGFNRRTFTTFLDAYCLRYGTNITFDGETVVSCAGRRNNSSVTSGTLMTENPQKAF